MSLAKFERKRVEDLLADHGLVSAEVLAKSVTEAQEKGVGLLSLLSQENRISESDAAQLLSKEYQIPFIKTSAYELQREALGELPREIVVRDGLVPLDRIGKTLVFAVADPPTPERAAALARLLVGPVQCYITTISEAAKTLGEHYRDLLQEADAPASRPPPPAPANAARAEPAPALPPPEAIRPVATPPKPPAAAFEADKQPLVVKARVGSRADMLEVRDGTRPRLQPTARAVVTDDEPPLFVKRALARQRAQAAAAAAPLPAPEPTPGDPQSGWGGGAPAKRAADLTPQKAAIPAVPAPAPITREAAQAPKPPESFEFEFE